MLLTQCDDMVGALAPDRPDQAFREAVLPRRARCNRLVADTHGLQTAHHNSTDFLLSLCFKAPVLHYDGAVHQRRGRAPKTPTLLDVLGVRGRLKHQNHESALPRVLASYSVCVLKTSSVLISSVLIE